MDGLSIIIVCHNGASRLPTTLAHLKMQESPKVPWELVVIDNASTDQTSKVALSCWKNGPAPIRVITEPRLGVRFARERGMTEAKYPLLGFVDDDNWVTSNWVRTASEIMSSDSSLGAVGSIREAECEVRSRPWFDNYHPVYAVLTESEFDQMEEPPTFLPTAGLCLRKAAWEGLVDNGFHFLLSGTVGGKLRGGEDTELTLALHLAGWRLRIDRRLRLRHLCRPSVFGGGTCAS
jgi:glycosyltransferase involved in cell wall biosynthesis